MIRVGVRMMTVVVVMRVVMSGISGADPLDMVMVAFLRQANLGLEARALLRRALRARGLQTRSRCRCT